MDGEAWQAAVHGVTQSQTRLKRLSSSSSNIPLYICTAASLSIHLLMGIQVASMFQLLQIVMQLILEYMFLFQFWFPQGICLVVGIWWFYSQFFMESPYCLAQCVYQFTSPPVMQERFLFSTPFPAFTVCRLFDEGHFDQCEVIPYSGFYISLVPSFLDMS